MKKEENDANAVTYEEVKEAFDKGGFGSAFEIMEKAPHNKEGFTYYVPSKYIKE